ncbi:MAG: tetratricopeptide repeat protein, partial [Rudaea sp.]
LYAGTNDLVRSRVFLSPFDTLRWAERLIGLADGGAQGQEFGRLAEECLRWGREWLPDDSRLWLLIGLQARSRGDRDRARACFERARRLNPGNIRTVLALLATEQEQPAAWQEGTAVTLRVVGPAQMAVGDQAAVECALEGAVGDWEVYALPPDGLGVLIEPRSLPVRAPGRCSFTVHACRPDRVRGSPWPLVFIAVSGSAYCLGGFQIAVPDEQPGRLLVVCTEDHEIQEERERLAVGELRRLLVDKSAFAGVLFAPWTHLIEAGSTLSMPEWAGAQYRRWNELARAVRDHLAEEVAAGNDVQAHYHAFNDPAADHFPYRLSGGAWSPDHRFLLTAEERRRDWADAFPPPNSALDRTPRQIPLDRVTSVERVVAQIEALGRLGDPDYRAVLWRSGQLEFGSSANDRAWSAVALCRAGLLADSDLKPEPSTRSASPEAFAASAQDPFVPEPGRNLLQLTIGANLEGDFSSDIGRLKTLVGRTVANLKDDRGAFKPGIHLVTLLTHDKFINARRGGDEARLDARYGDWVVIREHLQAWQAAGAERVTARQGIEAALDSGSWRPVPLLARETFIACDPNNTVRYSVRVLGAGIPISENCPHDVLLHVPPLLRSSVRAIRARQGERVLTVENEGNHAFWLTLTSRAPEIRCYFELAAPSGPRLESLEKAGERTWRLILSAPERYLRARLLIPWPLIGMVSSSGANDAQAPANDPDGLIVDIPPFERDADGNIGSQLVEVTV